MSLKRAQKQKKRKEKKRKVALNKPHQGISRGKVKIRHVSQEELRQQGWGTEEEVAQGKAQYAFVKVIKE